MTFEIWIAFVIAAGVVLIIPGPTIISVISYSLAHGRNAVFPIVAGVLLGDLTCMSFSLLGLGAVLAASATLFSVIKFTGALYLIYLGVRLWSSDPLAAESGSVVNGISKITLIRNLFLTTATNPKGIVFFMAFLPQFVNPKAAVSPQLLLLCGTFLFLASINATIYALFAGSVRESVRSARARRLFNRCGGTALIGAGLLTATMRHTS
jgi:threonine/homoserine/homoserine lactone efflux protein